jgi:protein ImuA
MVDLRRMSASPAPRSVAALPGGLSAHVWQGEALARAGSAAVPTGHEALDRQLPGGGWPLDGMVELLQEQAGQHVWRLLAPGLARAVAARPGPVVLVGPPHEPFGPGLRAQGLPGERLLIVRADRPAASLWAAEQALRCAEVAAVLAWLPQAGSGELRRLQLAAQQHPRLLFVFRAAGAGHESSPARLRLRLDGMHALEVHILKRRGPPLDAPVRLAPQGGRLANLLAARQGGPLAAPLPAATTAAAAAPGAPILPFVRPVGRKPHALDRAAAPA